MFENGSFLRRRKRFKLPKVDKEFLQKTLGSSFPSSSPGPMTSITPTPSSPTTTTTPPATHPNNGLSMSMSPPIPGMIPNSAFMSSQFSHMGGHHQFGPIAFGSHPMFLNSNISDARLLAAAAAAGYPRDLYGHHHAIHHHPHPHQHPNHLSNGIQQGFHSGPPPNIVGMSPKDLDDIREATRAIRSLREQSGKLHRIKPLSELDLSPPPHVLVKSSHPHLHSPPPAVNSETMKVAGQDVQPREKSSSANSLLTNQQRGKRRGGNSNNFSIENLIAKDKDSTDNKNIKDRKAVISGKDSSSGSDKLNNNHGCKNEKSDDDEEDEDIVMDDDEEEEGRVPSILSDSMSDAATDDRLIHLDNLSTNENDNESNHSHNSSERSQSHSPVTIPRKNLLVSPSPSLSSPRNGQYNNNGPSPGVVAVSAGNLLPSYPFYAAAFLSAQSLLYNQQYFGNGTGAPNPAQHHHHHHHHQQQLQLAAAAAAAAASAESGGGGAISPSSGHYPGHPGLNMSNPAAAMLFSGKHLSGL